MDRQALIEKYIAGQLSADELKLFNDMQKSDPAFRREVEFHDDLSVVINEEERQRLKSGLSKQKSGKFKKKNTARRIIMIVIGLLLLMSAFLGYQYEKRTKSPAGIYAAHFEPLPNTYLPVTRNSIDNVLTQGFTAYENGNYLLAAEKFEESIRGNRVLEVIFYQGICYGAIGNYPLAIKNLENIKRFESAYLDEAYWYLGLFYLKQNDRDRAIRHFQDFIELTADPEKKKDAIKILKVIM